jgi:hypothetical protein
VLGKRVPVLSIFAAVNTVSPFLSVYIYVISLCFADKKLVNIMKLAGKSFHSYFNEKPNNSASIAAAT